MQRFNKFPYGFIPGILFPVFFMWVYLSYYYPADISFFQVLKQLYPTDLFPKLLLLSVMPNLAFVFVFYKTESFKLATGIMVAAMPYFITSVVMW